MLKICVSAYFSTLCMHEFVSMSVPVYNSTVHVLYCTYLVCVTECVTILNYIPEQTHS